MPERRPPGFGRAPERRPDGPPVLDDPAAALLLPERSPRGHKGSFGKLLVLAGSLNYAGAAVLVVRAAGRAGAGLVTLAVPESLQMLFAGRVVEATTMPLPEDEVQDVEPEEALARILDESHDALVIGPGLRPGLATTELIQALLAIRPVNGEPEAAPVLLDAEALRSLATVEGWWEQVRRQAVLTPHVGEFARLRSASGRDPAADGDLNADDAARVVAAVDAAHEWRQVVVLKGARTVIASPDGAVAVAPFENPALASGGTGDVLSGTIGSASISTGWRAKRSASASAIPACWPPTSRMRSRTRDAGWRPWRRAPPPADASDSAVARQHRPRRSDRRDGAPSGARRACFRGR